MKTHTYRPTGVCTGEITFEVDGAILKNVQFSGGCSGNLQAICRLVEGMQIDDAMRRLRGIDCDNKGTSCPDQLARALELAVGAKRH